MKYLDLQQSGRAKVLKRTRSYVHLRVELGNTVLYPKHTDAWAVVMNHCIDKGMDAGAVEAWMWRVGTKGVMRMNNRIMYARIHDDPTLGEFRVCKDGWARRQHPGKCSTSLVRPRRSREEILG